MPLEEYRRKRDFGRTPEPAPSDVVERSGRFTVQRHRGLAIELKLHALEADREVVASLDQLEVSRERDSPQVGLHRERPFEKPKRQGPA